MRERELICFQSIHKEKTDPPRKGITIERFRISSEKITGEELSRWEARYKQTHWVERLHKGLVASAGGGGDAGATAGTSRAASTLGQAHCCRDRGRRRRHWRRCRARNEGERGRERERARERVRERERERERDRQTDRQVDTDKARA